MNARPASLAHKLDVLLVDDDPDYCELATAALRDCGQKYLLCVHDGQQALDYLRGEGNWQGRDTASQPRLVLLDLKMVGLQGLEVLRRIRAEPLTRDVPTVIHAGGDLQPVLRECYAAGANSVVRKTGDMDDLSRKLQGIFSFWLDANEPNG